MIIQLFIFSLLFFVVSVIGFIRKKKVIGFFFLLLGFFALLIGGIVVYLYPHTVPF
jgi:hypothetical protein